MIRRIVSFAIHQPLFLTLLLLLFIAGGVVAFKNLPIEAFPDVTDVQVSVVTLFPGHAPEEVEKQVTIPLEIELSGLPHSVRLFSHTQFGLSFIYLTFDDKVKKPATGGIAPFQPDTHLNLWVCPLTGGLLGYAQFPGGPPATDGVVINVSAFGTIGTAQAPFAKGRTATHEIGHYFNLRHIWGDTPDCSGSDMVADTPNCAGPNTGMPVFPVVTCNNGPNGDMFMNYMDYTDDAGMFMFTAQQVLRMRAALETSRAGLM